MLIQPYLIYHILRAAPILIKIAQLKGNVNTSTLEAAGVSGEAYQLGMLTSRFQYIQSHYLLHSYNVIVLTEV